MLSVKELVMDIVGDVGDVEHILARAKRVDSKLGAVPVPLDFVQLFSMYSILVCHNPCDHQFGPYHHHCCHCHLQR